MLADRREDPEGRSNLAAAWKRDRTIEARRILAADASFGLSIGQGGVKNLSRIGADTGGGVFFFRPRN